MAKANGKIQPSKSEEGSRYFFITFAILPSQQANAGEEHGMAQQSSVQTITHNLLAAINSKLMSALAVFYSRLL